MKLKDKDISKGPNYKWEKVVSGNFVEVIDSFDWWVGLSGGFDQVEADGPSDDFRQVKDFRRPIRSGFSGEVRDWRNNVSKRGERRSEGDS